MKYIKKAINFVWFIMCMANLTFAISLVVVTVISILIKGVEVLDAEWVLCLVLYGLPITGKFILMVKDKTTDGDARNNEIWRPIFEPEDAFHTF